MLNIWPLRRERRDSFEALLTPHMDHLYRLAYRFTGSRENAEDLVQDLMVRLYPRQKELLEVENLRPWLARSLYRLFVDQWRSAKRSPLTHSEDESALMDHAGNEPGPEAQTENDMLQKRLQHAMQALNEDQRILVNLHDVEGYTLNELESILNTPVGTLKSRLHRSRAKLREQLEMEPLGDIERVKE